jgi:hypothetical protein
MAHYILGVDYNSLPISTAYIRVGGQTKGLALQRAKKLGTVLVKRLPPDADLLVPREAKSEKGLFVYHVGVVIQTCIKEAKKVISEIVLRGSV